MVEIERQKRVIDMMLTMHSILKYRYLHLSSIFENTLIVSSVILNALVFVDNKYISSISHISEDNLKFIIGAASIIVFAISIVLIQVKWKEKAENHSKAGIHLFSLVQTCREILGMDDGEDKAKATKEFNSEYTQVMNLIVKIPDNKFNSLKLKHRKKIELSKLIDKHPGSLLVILKIKLFISSFKEKS